MFFDRNCGSTYLSSNFKNQIINVDLVVLVTATNEPEESYNAWALACYYHP